MQERSFFGQSGVEFFPISYHHDRMIGRILHLLALIALGMTAMQAAETEKTESSSAGSKAPLFQQAFPEETGINLKVPIDLNHPDDRLYYSAMACGSVASGDVDGDGRPDLFFACGPVPNRLYRQVDDFRFEDVTALAGIANAVSWSTGAAMIDVDNDRDLDIYVTRYDAPNQLYINESSPGKIRFQERSVAWGVNVVDASLVPTFADYDRDGDMDLFLGINAYYRNGGRPEGGVPMEKQDEGWKVLPPWDKYFGFSSLDETTGEPQYDEIGRPNRLLRNEGDRFVEVTGEAGISSIPSHTNAVAWWDYDEDGWLDLYVANDFSDKDELYRNLGNGKFEDVAAQVLQHTTWYSMGCAAADLNQDGLSDLVVADMLPTSHYRQKVTMGEMGNQIQLMRERGAPIQNMVNTFFVNTGTGKFLEAAFMSGLARTDWTWTVKSGDFDGDGAIDLFFPNGHSRDFNNSDLKLVTPDMRVGKNYWDFFEDIPELREKNLAFRNAGDLKFDPASDWGLDLEGMSYSATLSDLDRDGDLDMVVMNLKDPPSIYCNQSREEGTNHLVVELEGNESNRFGIGAKVTAELESGKKLVSTLLPFNGYLESDEPAVHFGLGKEEKVQRLIVEWPSGTSQVAEDLAGNQWHRIVEEPSSAEAEKEAKPKPWFKATGALLKIALKEDPYNDFAKQPLLPHQHSQLGPGQAWGDVDGDGALDVYLSGPKTSPGYLLISRGKDSKGRPVFGLRMKEPFTKHLDEEQLGVLFFEADGDGDPDLYVVNGSVECEPGAIVLQDRLLLNDGDGNFTPAETGALPNAYHSGSVVCAADFDRDEDLDLFVGGRVVPGQYPMPATSQLLINDGKGNFTEAEPETAKGLFSSGLVTSALWSDADGDGWVDLLVTYDWGAVKWFRNEEGTLVDQTAKSGLDQHLGHWNSIAGADLDADGDIDYITGNLGLNTKYSASHKKPILVYYGELGMTGQPRVVEAKTTIDGKVLPGRGFSCSSRAMPFIRQKIGSYHEFALSSLEDIYPAEKLEDCIHLEVNTLESMLWINIGKGRFKAVPLPRLAQIAPGFGIVMTDLDADGMTDAALAQNFFSNQEETGPMDGGLSLVLRGNALASDSERILEPLWPTESGVVVSGDSMSLGIGDLNKDGRPELLFGVNDTAPRLFLNQATKYDPISLTLKGGAGNPDAVGAMVTVNVEGNLPQTAEVSAGGGYLSQSSPKLFFGFGDSPAQSAQVEVRWPDGATTTHEIQRSKAVGVELSR